ncbi:MAG: Error-prone repair protein ImuA [Chitinophagaceae bacterium]|jgi:protein ImuA|nr:MAG: Error-prone repair protein ImuA [Chitinophagaceae bacterium]
MVEAKADIIRQLQQEILSLQGFNLSRKGQAAKIGLGVLEEAFPQQIFPTGVVHELISESPEQAAATNGFIAGIASTLMQSTGTGLWVSNHCTIYPPALQLFGLTPEKILFIKPTSPKDGLWAIEEALKCKAIAFVVGEIKELNFNESRRLQLAVEKSKVTGFIHRVQPKLQNTVACVTRWRIKPIASETNGMPGTGFTRWEVQLCKVRNGRPHTWELGWENGSFRCIEQPILTIPAIKERKTG